MDLLVFRDFCLALPECLETTPFDETTLVYKVGGRMFAMADMVDFGHIALKCDPEQAILLCDSHAEITPAYHMNKRHWIDVRTDGDLPEAMIRQLIRTSWLLVVRGNVTPRALREELLRRAADAGIE